MSRDLDLVLTNPFALPDVRRGSETLVHGLARWLNPQLAHPVVVMAGAPRPAVYDLEGVSYRRVRAPDLRRLHGDLDPETSLVPGLAARLRASRADLVHSFLYTDAASARLAGRPYVVSYGGIALPGPFRARRLKWRLFQWASQGARRILCPSRAAADHLRTAFGYHAEVVPNGFHAGDFWQPELERQPGLILCASTPDDRRKRVEVLVDAFGVLAPGSPDLRLVLAGSAAPPTRKALSERLPVRLRDRLEFTGDLPPDQLKRLYARAAVTCLPSLNEAFGLVLVESMAAGTPVVGAAHGAIPEIITPEVGATFEADDAGACATALAEVLGRGPDAAVEDCRRRAANFDWETVGPQYLSIYEESA